MSEGNQENPPLYKPDWPTPDLSPPQPPQMVNSQDGGKPLAHIPEGILGVDIITLPAGNKAIENHIHR